MRSKLGLFALLGACHGKDEGTPLPAAGDVEAVELTYAGEGQTASMPSVVRFDSAWHLYYTHQAGSIVGTYHAVSDDGLVFEDPTGRKLLSELIATSTDAVGSSVAYSSGSRVHLLSNTTIDGTSQLWHSTATDGAEFTLDDAPTFSDDSYGAVVEATGAWYEAAEVLGAFRVTEDGSADDRVVSLARSTNSGETWPDPATGFSPDDLPTPWTSDTVGAGGVWNATIADDPDGGYHMLFLGSGPNGDDALGIGQAWSGDGEVWSGDGELWYQPEDGTTINGLSLVEKDGSWILWFGAAATGENAAKTGALYRMTIE